VIHSEYHVNAVLNATDTIQQFRVTLIKLK